VHRIEARAVLVEAPAQPAVGGVADIDRVSELQLDLRRVVSRDGAFVLPPGVVLCSFGWRGVTGAPATERRPRC
jgi:hypothetical protein